MKFQIATVGALVATAAALPGMAAMRDQMAEALEKREADGILQGVGDTLEGVGDTMHPPGLKGTVEGLLGSVTKGTLDLNNKRPEPGYEFIAPGPGDSRGPCPGLNTLANHGYLPRNGYVTAGDVLEATSRGFNMAQDLAGVLVVFAVLSDGNIDEEAWWLGTDPTSGVGGLNRHSTVEADISPNREDFYNGCGDNHHVSSRMVKRNVNIVNSRPTKQFDIPAMAEHFAAQSEFAKTYNPTLYYFPFPMIVSVVAYNFYPRFFSNGTNELGGVANYESISSIVGFRYNEKHDEFEYVPERFPPNWYRRAFPYEALDALQEGFTQVYPANPALPPGFLQTTNAGGQLNTTNIGCSIYQGLNSITPLALAGQEQAAARKLSWAVGLLDTAFAGTALGCHHDSTISKNFYPNADQVGGPLNPPKAVQSNQGNNVYNKIYFADEPREPSCDHVMDPN